MFSIINYFFTKFEKSIKPKQKIKIERGIKNVFTKRKMS